jgi:hypothetical protein
MPFIAVSIVIQLLCAVHCVRNGRNSLWLMVIIFLSIPGCLAYAFFEILPGLAGRREVRAAKTAVIRKLDPERDLRAARDALELADTAANRVSLADALAEAGKWRDAVPHYEAALAKAPGGDRATRFKLARAELEAGRPVRARALIEALPPSASPSENDRAALLLARALEECGETEGALARYADLSARLPGGEPQCRQAALLMASGRRDEARAVLEEVERRVKRLDRHERPQHSDMYDWARRTLAELRSGAAEDGA